MAFDITKFRDKLSFAGQRPCLYEVRFMGKDESNVEIDFGLLSFRTCKVKFEGCDIDLEVIEDEDFSSFKLLEKFQECKLPKIEVYFYTKIGEVACKHLFEIYEHSIYLGTDLAWSDSESLMTWKVSLLSPTEPVVTFGTDNHD